MRHFRLYTFLCGLLLTALAYTGGTTANRKVCEVVLSCPQPQQGTVNDATKQSHHPAAIISSDQERCRLSNTRPQRVLPTQGSKAERMPGRFSPACKHSHSPLSPRNDRRWRLETAPFQSAASRLYYVIALRHLLC